MDETAYPFVSRICLIVVIGIPLSLTAHARRARPSARYFLCHRVQSVTLYLRVKLLEDPLAQRMPELWGNKVRQLNVQIVLVGAFWQHIVVQRGALLTLQ